MGFKITKYPTKLLNEKNYTDTQSAWCSFLTLEDRELVHMYYLQ